MICLFCQNEQAAGNYCTVCGKAFHDSVIHEKLPSEPIVHVAQSTKVEPVSTASRTNRVSKHTGQYTAYVNQVLKQPSKGFAADERHFSYGLLSIFGYILAYALSIYFLANKVYSNMMGGLASLFSETGSQQSLPFINFTSSIFLYVFLFVIASITCMYFVTQFMGEGISLRLLVAQYGSVILPFAVLNTVAIIFGLIGLTGLTLFTTGLSLFFIIYIIPALTIYNRGIKSSRTVQVVYWSVGTTAASMLISYIIVRIFVIDFISQIQNVTGIL